MPDKRAGEVLLIREAFAKLGPLVPTVELLVRSIHIISSRGPGYDCSHSEPTIPFSILVSVPLGERHAALRLAESILHEAMHLQLTLIEEDTDLVTSQVEESYSPWQQQLRPAQGLLHGLYVFAAIDDWLAAQQALPNLSVDDRTYVDRLRGDNYDGRLSGNYDGR